MATQRAKFSFAGIGLGAVALLLALAHFWAGPFSTQPTLENVVAEKAVAIRDATLSALKGKPPASSTARTGMNLDQALELATAMLGGLAIILGVFGYARKEPLRVAGGAAVLGGGALAFQFAALALGAIVVAILVAAVLSQLGFG